MNWFQSLFHRPTRRFYTVVYYNPQEAFKREHSGVVDVCAPAQLERYCADCEETAWAMFRSDNPGCIPISISFWK